MLFLFFFFSSRQSVKVSPRLKSGLLLSYSLSLFSTSSDSVFFSLLATSVVICPAENKECASPYSRGSVLYRVSSLVSGHAAAKAFQF